MDAFCGRNFRPQIGFAVNSLIADVSVMKRNSANAFAEFLTCFESTIMANPCSKGRKSRAANKEKKE